MIGIFAFDGPLYKDINGVYCNTTVTNEMLSRYFSVVDKLYVIMRTLQLNITYQQANLKKLEVGPALEIIEIPNLLTPTNFISKNKYVHTLRQYIEKSDLIFLRIPSLVSNMCADICRNMKKPYFAEVGGCAWDSYFNHGILGKIIAPYMFLKEKQVVKNAYFASYVTEHWLQRRYPTNSKSIVASNVYLNHFDELNVNNRIANYKTKNTRYKLGTIAAVNVRYKGQADIIKAIAQLNKQGILVDYELVGTGDPGYIQSLSRKYGVEDQVHCLGVKLHDDIWEWLDQIDIYVQPSRQEGLPRAVIEAMNRGCMTAGSNVAGIPELLEQDTVFHCGNVQEITNILITLINESNHDKRIIRNFQKSKQFELSILEGRRNRAFNEYKLFIEGINNGQR